MMVDDNQIQRIQQHRLQQVCHWLKKSECAAIILFDPVNIRYATGSRNMQVWTMHNFCRYCLVFENGKSILFEFPSAMHLAKNLDNIDEIRPAISVDYLSVAYRGAEMADRWCDEILQLLTEQGVAKEKIAIDRADLGLLHVCQSKAIDLVDGKGVMERARSIKSQDEIDALQWSLSTCEQSVRTMREKIVPGMRESDALAMMIQGAVELGGEYPETRLLTSGPRTNPWFQETSDRVLNDGDMLAFDTDMVGPLGFYNDISRSWVVGDKRPTDKQRYLYSVAYQQLQHNMSLLKAGVGFLEYSDQSYQLPESCIANRYADVAHGCGLGVEYPFIWYREDAQWGAYDGVFEENMVVCVECYVGEKDGYEGVKLEQPVLIKSQGPVLLSQFPLEEDYLI